MDDSSATSERVQRMPVLSMELIRTSPNISITPMAPGARFSLRMRPSTVAELTHAGPFRLDTPINTCVVANDYIAARLGPDEWLLLGPDLENERIADTLNAALAGKVHSLVDIGHRNAGIAISGSRARDVLNGGCPLDLRDEGFPPHTATRTLIGKSEIVLLRPGTESSWRVECSRSFAPYVYRFLKEGAREFSSETRSLQDSHRVPPLDDRST